MIWGLLFNLLPFLAGILVPLGGAVSSQASLVFGSFYWAVAWAYGSGLLVILPWSFLTVMDNPTWDVSLTDLWVFICEKPRVNWLCLSMGVCGAYQSCCAAYVSGRMGVGFHTAFELLALSILCPVLDYTGWCWYKKVLVDWKNLLGGLIMAIGCVLFRLDWIVQRMRIDGWGMCVLVALISISSGCAGVFQVGTAGQSARLMKRFRRSCTVSYLTSFVTVVTAAGLFSPINLKFEFSQDYWKLTSGFIRMTMFTCSTVAAMHLSASIIWAYYIMGQVFNASLLESFGWLGMTRKVPDTLNIVGTLVVAIGVLITTYARITVAASAQIKIEDNIGDLEKSKVTDSEENVLEAYAENKTSAAEETARPINGRENFQR